MPRTRLTAERLEDRLAPALGDLLQSLNFPGANLGDNFGNAVAVDGNLAVVGVATDDPGGVTNAGTAYVFNVTTGALVATLNNPAPAEFDSFGRSVAISGTAVVVGADADDPGGVPDAGSAYVFDISTGPAPTPLATLVNPNPSANEYFGAAVAISGTRVVVGSFDTVGPLQSAGAAYAFDILFGPNPFPIATLKNPAPSEQGSFGSAVALSGNLAVVGASHADPGGVADSGAAYVFNILAGPIVGPIATLVNPSPAANDQFGRSVAIDGGRVVVGAFGHTLGGQSFVGQAHVFTFEPSSKWAAAATLDNPTPNGFDFFGNSVAISGSRVLVGAGGDDVIGADQTGSAYLFDVPFGGTPALLATLNSPSPGSGDNFGVVVALSGTRAVVGALLDDTGGVTDTGSAFAFDLNPPLAVGGAGGAAAVFAAGNGVFGAKAVATLSPVAGFAGQLRTATADVNADGLADTIVVTGPGTPIRVAVISGADNKTVLVAPFDPYGGDFTGGGYVAAADLDRDGRAEFVVTPDQGGGPRVSVFTRNPDGNLATRANFLGIDDANFRGGTRAALGDVNGDGTPDVVVAAGFGGGPRTAIFTGQSVLGGAPDRLVADFFAFPGSDAVTLRNGTFVAAGDVTGDGFADLVFGGGPGGGPRVFILSGLLVFAGDVAGAQAAPVANFFVAGNAADRGGVRVAAKDADGDGRADVAAGSGEGAPSRVRVYPGAGFAGGGEPTGFHDLDPFAGAALPGGVFVG